MDSPEMGWDERGVIFPGEVPPEVVGMGNRELKLVRDPACTCPYSPEPHVHWKDEEGR